MVVPVDGTGVGDEGDMKAPNGAEGCCGGRGFEIRAKIKGTHMLPSDGGLRSSVYNT